MLVTVGLYREVAALQRHVDYHTLVMLRAREAGCFREVAAIYTANGDQTPLHQGMKTETSMTRNEENKE